MGNIVVVVVIVELVEVIVVATRLKQEISKALKK